MQRISPSNESEAADAVRAAGAGNTPFEIVSAGTKREFGRAAAADTILDTSALSGIVDYEPEELVITARAATPLSEIETILAARQQMLGFSPADWGPLFGAPAGRATLAGIVAANSSGARRIKAGAVRDHVIGCRFINGEGEIIKAGGKVIKNVTGFDLPRLMCGAMGTLGILTELTFRVVPAPHRRVAIALCDLTPEAGLAALRQAAALAIDPVGLSYLPSAVLSPSAGAAQAGIANRSSAAIVWIEGANEAIAEKRVYLKKHFSGFDIADLNDTASAQLFREVSDGACFVQRGGDLSRLVIPSTAAPAALIASGARNWYADWAGGLLWLELEATAEMALLLRTITAQSGGHATLMRANAEARKSIAVFEPEPPVRAKLTRSVKTAFDPKHLFNPGRMFETL